MDYTIPVQNGRLQYVNTQIGTAGFLVIGTAAMDGLVDADDGVLVKVPFANPAFIVDAGAMDVNALPRTIAAIGTGLAAKVEFRNSADLVIANNISIGLLTDPDPDIELRINALDISTGQTVQITLGTIVHG